MAGYRIFKQALRNVGLESWKIAFHAIFEILCEVCFQSLRSGYGPILRIGVFRGPDPKRFQTTWFSFTTAEE